MPVVPNLTRGDLATVNTMFNDLVSGASGASSWASQSPTPRGVVQALGVFWQLRNKYPGHAAQENAVLNYVMRGIQGTPLQATWQRNLHRYLAGSQAMTSVFSSGATGDVHRLPRRPRRFAPPTPPPMHFRPPMPQYVPPPRALPRMPPPGQPVFVAPPPPPVFVPPQTRYRQDNSAFSTLHPGGASNFTLLRQRASNLAYAAMRNNTGAINMIQRVRTMARQGNPIAMNLLPQINAALNSYPAAVSGEDLPPCFTGQLL